MIVNGTAVFAASRDGSTCSEPDKGNFTQRRIVFVDQKFVVLVILIFFRKRAKKLEKEKKKNTKSQKSEFFSIILSANLFKKSQPDDVNCEPQRTLGYTGRQN
jgi:hypothetical protein